jgi:hypothetical protein
MRITALFFLSFTMGCGVFIETDARHSTFDNRDVKSHAIQQKVETEKLNETQSNSKDDAADRLLPKGKLKRYELMNPTTGVNKSTPPTNILEPKSECDNCTDSQIQGDRAIAEALVKWLGNVLRIEGFVLNCHVLSTLSGNKCHNFVNRINEILDGSGPLPPASAGPMPSKKFSCLKLKVALACGNVLNHVYHALTCPFNGVETAIYGFDFWSWNGGALQCVLVQPFDTHFPRGKF